MKYQINGQRNPEIPFLRDVIKPVNSLPITYVSLSKYDRCGEGDSLPLTKDEKERVEMMFGDVMAVKRKGFIKEVLVFTERRIKPEENIIDTWKKYVVVDPSGRIVEARLINSSIQPFSSSGYGNPKSALTTHNEYLQEVMQELHRFEQTSTKSFRKA